jgi:hypothetical protein
MSERQRTGRPAGSGTEAGEEEGSGNLDEVRDLAERMMVSARRSLQELGLNNASDFLNATRQSGGQ